MGRMLLFFVLLSLRRCAPFVLTGFSRGGSDLRAGPPVINEYEVMRGGFIRGVVTGHPSIEDGETLETSKISTSLDDLKKGLVVKTISGSKYKIGNPKVKRFKAFGSSKGANSGGGASSSSSGQVSGTVPALSNALLNVAGSRYVIVKNSSFKSPSGKSRIYKCFSASPTPSVIDMMSTPDPSLSSNVQLTSEDVKGVECVVKVSPNEESMKRESSNYDKVNGIFATIGALSVFDSESHFVKKLKFQKGIVGNAAFWKTEQGGKEAKRCALVLEKGDCDLKVSAGAPMSMSTSACCACASFRRACEQAKEIGDRWIDG